MSLNSQINIGHTGSQTNIMGVIINKMSGWESELCHDYKLLLQKSFST